MLNNLLIFWVVTAAEKKKNARKSMKNNPFTCLICGKGCIRQWNLDRHMKNKHQSTEGKLLYSFIQLNKLKFFELFHSFSKTVCATVTSEQTLPSIESIGSADAESMQIDEDAEVAVNSEAVKDHNEGVINDTHGNFNNPATDSVSTFSTPVQNVKKSGKNHALSVYN